MVRLFVFLLVLTLFGSAVCPQSSAQNQRNKKRNPQNRNQPGKKEQEKPPALPTDQRLLALHKTFVKDAEKLAMEYERGRDWDKARDVYSEILKLVPQYTEARNKLEEIRLREASAKNRKVKIKADDEWQDSGIIVQQGKPFAIRASGTWTFVLQAEITPDGIPIPEELREFNLGTLIGYVDTGDREKDKPFAIGAGKEMVAEQTGKLYLRMYDMVPKDNDGFLNVEIQGTFEQK